MNLNVCRLCEYFSEGIYRLSHINEYRLKMHCYCPQMIDMRMAGMAIVLDQDKMQKIINEKGIEINPHASKEAYNNLIQNELYMEYKIVEQAYIEQSINKACSKYVEQMMEEWWAAESAAPND